MATNMFKSKIYILIILGRIDEALENLVQDQFEILLYKKNSKSTQVTYSTYI